MYEYKDTQLYRTMMYSCIEIQLQSVILSINTRISKFHIVRMLYLGVILNIALYHIVHREKLWPSKYIDFCYIATEFYLIGLIGPTPSNNNNPLFLIPLSKYCRPSYGQECLVLQPYNVRSNVAMSTTVLEWILDIQHFRVSQI